MQLTPSSFLQAIRSGVDPHVALIEWGKQRKRETEKMQKIRLETVNKPRHTEPISLDEIANEPTMLMPLFNLSKGEFGLPVDEIERLVQDSPNMYSRKVEVAKVDTEEKKPSIRLDSKNRPYIAAKLNPYVSITALVEALIDRYKEIIKRKPAAIILSTALLYLACPSDCFTIGETHIPYIYDPCAHEDIPGVEFDVLVRGQDGDSWVL